MPDNKKEEQNCEALVSENGRLKQSVTRLKKRVAELETGYRGDRFQDPEYFKMRVDEEIERADSYKYEFSVMLLELDNLEIYKRRNGDNAAAEILGMLDIVMQDSLRTTDLKCRLAAGRYTALLPYTDSIGAQKVAEKTRQAIEKVLALKSVSANTKFTASIGLASYPASASSTEGLLTQCREAFARARTAGNSIGIASTEASSPAAATSHEAKPMQNDSFLRVLDDEVTRCSRYGLKFSLMVLAVADLETEKNNLDGATKAKIMRAVYQKITRSMRTIDKCHLYTDSRLALLLPGTSADGAAVVAQKMIQELTTKPILKDAASDIVISLSIGITSFPADEVAREGLLRKVEVALSHASGKGKNRYSQASETASQPNEKQRDISEWMAMLKDGGPGAVFNLQTIVDMTERYDPPHSQAVARHAMAMGQAMGLTGVSIQRLRVIAMLHDVGKICIPPAIITKPGPLRDDEWETMISHPQYGAAILGQLPDFAYCSLPVLSHHEMWDGKGYPHGIKGEKIPLESRIISVAEAFDDMVSLRPYRSQVMLEDAITELKSKAGTQFDPAIVAAFLKTLP